MFQLQIKTKKRDLIVSRNENYVSKQQKLFLLKLNKLLRQMKNKALL